MSDGKLTDKKPDEAPVEIPAKAPSGLARIAIVGVIAIASIAYVVTGENFRGPQNPSSNSQVASIGGPFTLTEHTGKVVTERDFRGKFMLLTFGYTYCPDVCPTTLSKMATALDLLGEAATAVTPVFFSIDPARDTPEHLKEYVGFFHPRLRGLTGTPEQVAAAAKVFKIYYAKAKSEAGADADDYTMDHSALTYLIGPDGKFLTYFSHIVEAKEMALGISEFLP